MDYDVFEHYANCVNVCSELSDFYKYKNNSKGLLFCLEARFDYSKIYNNHLNGSINNHDAITELRKIFSKLNKVRNEIHDEYYKFCCEKQKNKKFLQDSVVKENL